MFTGIITGVGHITAVQALGDDADYGKRITVQTPSGYLSDTQLGDSIALNGACMTLTAFDAAAHWFTVDISAASLEKTAGLGRTGAVNLEKALRAQDRLGGHLVSGHVDGLGWVKQLDPIGESWLLRIQAPAELAAFLAYKGSIAVQGVSLTINQVCDHPENATTPAHTDFDINIIPHTMAHTTLGDLRPEDRVHLEVDVIARYCERMLSYRNAAQSRAHA